MKGIIEKLFWLVLLLVGWLIFVSLMHEVGFADPGRQLIVVTIPGPAGYCSAETIKQAEAVVNLIKETGVRISLRQVIEFPVPVLIENNNLNTQGGVFNQLISIARYNGWVNDGMVHFILPPMLDGGKRWVGGWAAAECAGRWNRISMSNATPANHQGIPRIAWSLIAATHEVGHLMGARHDRKNFNMMLPAFSLSEVNSQRIPRWNATAKAQIRKCMRAK